MTSAMLANVLASRVLVLDGAMGTMLLAHPCTEPEVRGDRFATHDTPLRRNVDLLCLTQPALVASVHDRYLAAGADIITTNSFRATSLAQQAFGLAPVAVEMARAAARLARGAADAWSAATPERPRWVAGSLGPVPRGAATPERRDAVETAYCEQVLALLEGGVDLLLLETMTSFDSAAAATRGARDAFTRSGLTCPILVSFSPTASAEDLARARALDVTGLGLNCAEVGDGLWAALRTLAGGAAHVTCHPSAGLPVNGTYAGTPDGLAQFARASLEEGLLGIVGGCCGTTPAHTHALAEVARSVERRRV
jgi:5-methyltetrahydrofolate--homocysteine methyltransferase